MTLTTQYALDTYRLQQHGEAPPPAPGTHEAKLLRAWWTARKEARRAWAETEDAPTGRTAASGQGAAAPRRLRRRPGRA